MSASKQPHWSDGMKQMTAKYAGWCRLHGCVKGTEIKAGEQILWSRKASGPIHVECREIVVAEMAKAAEREEAAKPRCACGCGAEYPRLWMRGKKYATSACADAVLAAGAA